jgi:lipoate-protein ligase B
MNKVKLYSLGQVEYEKSLLYQKQAHKLCQDRRLDGAIFILEHPHVITLGKNSKTSHLLTSPEKLKQLLIPLIRVERGGNVTSHMPGQLIIYPILNLQKLQFSVRSYVFKLEQIITKTLAAFNIRANARPNYPGVWVKEKKICSIGIRIYKRISMHGLALNVNNNLNDFKHIVPCGIANCPLTSMKEEANLRISFDKIIPVLLSFIKKELMIELTIEQIKNIEQPLE